MDAGVGKIMDWVAAHGLEEDTVLIFTSDNGMNLGQHGIWGKGNGTFPMNMYDSAVKVPFLISWPCHIAPGSVCCEIVSAYDLFPTLLELTGLSDRFPEGLPGKSFSSLLTGGEQERTGEIVF